MIPLFFAIETSPALISGTMSGTSGSKRQAELLSMTTAPLAAATGAHCFEVLPPAEKRAMSTPLKESSLTARTSISSPLNTTFLPAERGEASGMSSETGNFLCSSV